MSAKRLSHFSKPLESVKKARGPSDRIDVKKKRRSNMPEREGNMTAARQHQKRTTLSTSTTPLLYVVLAGATLLLGIECAPGGIASANAVL